MRMPGMKVRKKKPATCLRTGISKPRADNPIIARAVNNTLLHKAMQSLISQLLGDFIWIRCPIALRDWCISMLQKHGAIVGVVLYPSPHL